MDYIDDYAADLPVLKTNLRQIVIIAGIALLLTSLAAATRIYVRLRILKCFILDDWLMVTAQFFFLLQAILIIIGNKWIMITLDGRLPPVSLDVQYGFIKWYFASYYLATSFIKLSFACFMLQIFRETHLLERAAICFFTGISCLIGLAGMVMSVSTCADIMWIPCSLIKPHEYLSIAFSISNCVSDAAFVVLAVRLLWPMTMTLAAKMSTMFLFLLGCTGGVASIMRVCAYFDDSHHFIKTAHFARWTVIESAACILAVCLFTLRPLFQRCLDSRKTAVYSDNRTGILGRTLPMLERGHVAALQTHGLVGPTDLRNHHSDFGVNSIWPTNFMIRTGKLPRNSQEWSPDRSSTFSDIRLPKVLTRITALR